MNLQSIILIGGLVYVLSMYGKANAGKRLITRMVNVMFAGGQLRLVFEANNPTGSPIVVNAVLGEVTANGKQVAIVSNYSRQVIAANSASALEVVVKPSLLTMANYLANAFGTKFALTVGFSGQIRVEGGYMIDVKQSYKIA